MKITREQLHDIISEEIENVMKEISSMAAGNVSGYSGPKCKKKRKQEKQYANG